MVCQEYAEPATGSARPKPLRMSRQQASQARLSASYPGRTSASFAVSSSQWMLRAKGSSVAHSLNPTAPAAAKSQTVKGASSGRRLRPGAATTGVSSFRFQRSTYQLPDGRSSDIRRAAWQIIGIMGRAYSWGWCSATGFSGETGVCGGQRGVALRRRRRLGQNW